MSTPVTIATWNLERPGYTSTARTQAILQQLRQINADIWILTETNQQLRLPGYDSLATPDLVRHQCRQGERTTLRINYRREPPPLWSSGRSQPEGSGRGQPALSSACARSA